MRAHHLTGLRVWLRAKKNNGKREKIVRSERGENWNKNNLLKGPQRESRFRRKRQMKKYHFSDWQQRNELNREKNV
jgi:hypothetical protein